MDAKVTYLKKIYSTFVELKYLLYVCRVNSNNVEYAIIKNRRRTDEYFMEAEKSLYERFTRYLWRT